MRTTLRKGPADQSGAVAIIGGIVILVLIGAAAVALDIAHMVVVKSQLQKAADAGAMAGARGLWPTALPVTAATSTSRTPDCTTADNWARTTATGNKVGNTNLSPAEVTVEVGRWDYATRTFTPGWSTTANAVRVNTRRNGVVMLFARVFGIDTADLAATSTAVMDFAGTVGKGCLPIAVNQDYAKTPGITVFIGFNPDPEDNGGWFAEPPDSASASTFKDYIINDSCPPLKIGDTINLENGTDSSVLSLLKDELALHPGGWDTFLPVVDTPKFNHSDQIDAFVPVRITEVQDTGNPKYVKCTVLTMADMGSALPGGAGFGALAPPKLVN